MFTKARSDVASGVTGRLHEQAAAAAEYLVWSDRSACVRAGLDHGSIDEACWLDLVGEAQMITYQKVLRGRRYWSPANMFRWIPSYSIVEIHVREELTKVLKANKLRVAWDAREAPARASSGSSRRRGAPATRCRSRSSRRSGASSGGVEGAGCRVGRMVVDFFFSNLNAPPPRVASGAAVRVSPRPELAVPQGAGSRVNAVAPAL